MDMSRYARHDGRSERWLNIHSLKNDVILTPDDDKFSLTINSENTQIIDNILAWLIQLTDKLDHQAMYNQSAKTPLFFAWPKSTSLITYDEVNTIVILMRFALPDI